MIVSRLSCFFSGAKSTSLEEQGIAGQTAEIVVSSWIEKLGGASRRVALRMPPGFGVSAEFATETGRTARSAQTQSLQLGLFISWASSCQDRRIRAERIRMLFMMSN